MTQLFRDDINAPGVLSFWLVGAGEFMLRDIRQYFDPVKITALQFSILNACYRGISTVSSISQTLPVGPPAVSRQVDQLYERGLLDRIPSQVDRRVMTLELTDAGRELVPRLLTIVAEWEAKVTADLSDAEKAFLISITRKLVATMRDQ